jgi:hypothetical protein
MTHAQKDIGHTTGKRTILPKIIVKSKTKIQGICSKDIWTYRIRRIGREITIFCKFKRISG